MKVKVCLVQDSPVFFDKAKTLDKIEDLVAQYAAQGCQLIVFPESFVPGYPRGMSFGATVGSRSDAGRALYTVYHRQSIEVGSQDTKRLVELSAKHQVYLAIGITERQPTNGSLYCSLLYISPVDGLLGVHRKLKPTGTERIVWAEADGSDLVTFDTTIGKLGGLICWENYMPLARMAMYQKNVQIYLAPTADARERWTASMQHIALEGRCFVLGCNQYFTKSMYPAIYQKWVADTPEDMCRGGSVIVSPTGKLVAGPLYDQAGVLTAELDLSEINHSKLDFDVVGHYSRNDVFKFHVPQQPAIQREGTSDSKA